jgi:hypothetical protein
MAVAPNVANGAPSPSELNHPNIGDEELTNSSEKSPTRLENDEQDTSLSSQKKKKKKKPKKSPKAKEAAAALKAKAQDVPEPDTRPPALCISRNKHWRYISSYHVCAIYHRNIYETYFNLRDHGFNSRSNYLNLYSC